MSRRFGARAAIAGGAAVVVAGLAVVATTGDERRPEPAPAAVVQLDSAAGAVQIDSSGVEVVRAEGAAPDAEPAARRATQPGTQPASRRATEPATQPASPAQAAATAQVDTAIFAAGCFWCAEADFQKVPGVLDAVSGYTGGTVPNPTYEQVTAGGTGHREVVRVTYDPARVGYGLLLDVFWRNVDPVDAEGQFCDKGESYTSAIYALTPEQRTQAEASKRAIEQSGRFDQPLATEIEPGAPFYVAEEYHQEYYQKNPIRYKFYRTSCGRDRRLEEVWG